MQRLEGVQRELALSISTRLLKLESKLKMEWSEVLLQEELLWKQKSRVEWLKVLRESASYAINCGIKKRSSSTHEESQHTQGINMVRPFAYVHGERGSLFCLFSKGST